MTWTTGWWYTGTRNKTLRVISSVSTLRLPVWTSGGLSLIHILRLADTPIRVAEGMEGLLEAASLEAADTVLTAVVGIVGLRPTLAAIRAGKRIALANKETLVCAGELVSDAAAWSG